MISLIIILSTVAALHDPFASGRNDPAPLRYSQSLPLHPGWNLVSWHIEPLEPPIFMPQILPDDSSGINDWFFDHGGKLYMYDDANPYHYYYSPSWQQSAQWVWDLNWTYYIWLDDVSAEDGSDWQFANRPRFDLEEFPIEPDPAWDDSLDVFTADNYVNGWFFVGYSAPGYCKLATIYDTWPPQNGSASNRTYRGPFHWLYWENDELDGFAHYGPDEQYLVIVKSDDGRVYLPYDLNPNHPYRPMNGQEYDEIGVLEPGRGYFLGFREATGANPGMENFSWANYPGWPQSLPPDPKASQAQTASANHFQFKPYTHWSYPVIIDTVDLAECPIVSGDEIGIFDGNLCVGASVYAGQFPLVIAAWEDDMARLNVLDGYIAGNEMTFVWYDVSQNQEVTFELPPETQAVADDPVAPTHSGFGAGLYAVRSLVYGVESVQQLPQNYRLGQNYPNPFNAETVIPLELPQRSQVKIELFNVKGQNLGVIYEGIKNAGWEKVRYNASRLSSGVYFYRITAEGLERGENLRTPARC